MHWIDRGPEPPRLSAIRNQYTPSWVAHYRNNEGAKPPGDNRWRDFRNDLQAAFLGLCGYCEEFCNGETDHFRPKSRSPELVYEWSNWILACHDCNHAKGNKWPAGGYVNPCAKSKPARPANFFTFNTATGEIIPKPNLSPARFIKAQKMIYDLGLNDSHHLKKRLHCLWAISEILNMRLRIQDSTLRRLVDWRTEFSSIVRVFLAEQGYSVDT